ncbi:Holliday junction resolvase RecU, partial [Staphylococcus aureus]|uniref:Holliday junction resolvase RecU n=1 Tax=Staphylococcus aureus TaxID=1280 RepID=UPI00200A6965
MKQQKETLEKIIESVAHMYRLQNRAYIFKRPVEKSFVKGRSVGGVVVGSKINYHGKAGVDFNGFICGKGQFIGFETKQIKTTKNFSLQLLHQHQLEELQFIQKGGGLSFLLIHFLDKERNDFFLVPVDYIVEHNKGFKVRRKKEGQKYKVVHE